MQDTWTATVKGRSDLYESENNSTLLTSDVTLGGGDKITVVGGAKLLYFDNKQLRVLPVKFGDKQYYIRADDI